ncbi:DUF2511 domain-containing protein [Psychrobacter sp. CAL346-MNA-CIBAN-0220]|uniref:DUF2511 domain-containing protein n=1 Tax=Psychrobacter sp. CAL346-MNA-CIBAN-0220 TaxID=3140457 RepID=UPI00332B2BC4
MSKLKSRFLIAAVIIIALILAAITVSIINISVITDPYMNEQIIEKHTFKGQWPFTVEEGSIKCDNIDDNKALSFNTFDGITYALNDDAQAYSNDKNLGWQPLNTGNIEKPDVSMTDINKMGLKLCELEKTANF